MEQRQTPEAQAQAQSAPPPGNVPSHASDANAVSHPAAQPTPSVMHAVRAVPPPPPQNFDDDGDMFACRFRCITIGALLLHLAYAGVCIGGMEAFESIATTSANSATVIFRAKVVKITSGFAIGFCILCVPLDVYAIIVSGSLDTPKGLLGLKLWTIGDGISILVCGMQTIAIVMMSLGAEKIYFSSFSHEENDRNNVLLNLVEGMTIGQGIFCIIFLYCALKIKRGLEIQPAPAPMPLPPNPAQALLINSRSMFSR